MEKKNLIEKLQEKMTERLGVINDLLANHAVSNAPQPEEKSGSQQAPSIVKNNIKLINLNLGQTKYSYNFYNKPPINEHQYDWSKAFKKNPQYKVKKNLTRTRASFKNKRHTSQMAVNNYKEKTSASGSASKVRALNPHRSLQVKNSDIRQSSENAKQSHSMKREIHKDVKIGRRKSIDGFKGLVNKFFEPNEEDNEGRSLLLIL